MSLEHCRLAGVQAALEKFALSGEMYSRALGNAAGRAGTRIAPQVLSQVAAQPRASGSAFLNTAARTPGVMAPTPGQQSLQTMMAKVPYAGAEHGGDPMAHQRFNEVLQQHGKVRSAPPGLNQRITDSFGPLPGAPAPAAATTAGKRRLPLGLADTVNMRTAL